MQLQTPSYASAALPAVTGASGLSGEQKERRRKAGVLANLVGGAGFEPATLAV